MRFSLSSQLAVRQRPRSLGSIYANSETPFSPLSIRNLFDILRSGCFRRTTFQRRQLRRAEGDGPDFGSEKPFVGGHNHGSYQRPVITGVFQLRQRAKRSNKILNTKIK